MTSTRSRITVHSLDIIGDDTGYLHVAPHHVLDMNGVSKTQCPNHFTKITTFHIWTAFKKAGQIIRFFIIDVFKLLIYKT